jgi:hypothetical protein
MFEAPARWRRQRTRKRSVQRRDANRLPPLHRLRGQSAALVTEPSRSSTNSTRRTNREPRHEIHHLPRRRRADRRPTTADGPSSRGQRAGISKTLTMLQRGQALHLQFDHRRGHVWHLSDGTRIDAEIAQLLVARPDVVPVGDALFRNAPSQTYRYIETGET